MAVRETRSVLSKALPLLELRVDSNRDRAHRSEFEAKSSRTSSLASDPGRTAVVMYGTRVHTGAHLSETPSLQENFYHKRHPEKFALKRLQQKTPCRQPSWDSVRPTISVTEFSSTDELMALPRYDGHLSQASNHERGVCIGSFLRVQQKRSLLALGRQRSQNVHSITRRS